MLDAQAVIGRRRAGERALERVEDERVGAIADRVHAHLEAPAERLEGQPLHLGAVHQYEAGVAGIVAVGLVQRGAARAERAVGHELERTDREAAITEALGPALAVVFPRRLRTAGDRDVVAEREFPALEQPAIGGECVELGAHLMDAGEPHGQAVREALAHRPAPPHGAAAVLRPPAARSARRAHRAR